MKKLHISTNIRKNSLNEYMPHTANYRHNGTYNKHISVSECLVRPTIQKK